MSLLWGERRGRSDGLVLALPRAGTVQSLRTRRARGPGDGIRLRTPLHHAAPARRARRGGGCSGRRIQAVSRHRASGVEGPVCLPKRTDGPCCSTLDTSVPKLLRFARRGRGGRMPGGNHGTRAGPSSWPTSVLWRREVNQLDKDLHRALRLVYRRLWAFGCRLVARQTLPSCGGRGEAAIVDTA